MKKFLILFLFASSCYASGKLSLTGNYFTQDSKTFPAVGFNIYEPLGPFLFYDGFAGGGIAPRHNWPDVYWIVTRHDIGVKIYGGLSLSMGATLRLSEQEWIGVEDESNLHARVSYTFWE